VSGNGIIEVKDALIRADRVIIAEQDGDNVVVTIGDMDSEYTVYDCSLADFREEWRRAMTY